MTGIFRLATLVLASVFVLLSACGGARPDGPPISEPTTSCNDMVDVQFDDEIIDSVQLSPVCYRVQKFVRIREGGSLSIPPNTILKFDADAGLMVDGGNLFAQGTQDQPILFTGRVENPGYWAGIYVHHTNATTVQNAIVRYAGGKDYLETERISAGIALHGDITDGAITTPLVKFASNRIEKSGGYGIYLGPKADLEQLTNNVIQDSQNQPVRVSVDMIQRIDTTNDLSQNRLPQIYIEGGQIGDRVPTQFVNAFNWPFHQGISYYISEDFEVFTPLIVNPGTTFVFAKDTGMKVTGKQAYLSAKGSANNPIIFTGEQKIPGYWKGLTFKSTDSTSNELDYVTIEYAGASKSVLEQYTAGLTLDKPYKNEFTSIYINNSVISNNDGYGFFVHEEARLNSLSNTRVFDNTQGAGVLPLIGLNNISDNNSFAGNTDNHVLLSPADIPRNEVLENWLQIDVPYRIIDDAIIEGGVYITSGVNVEVAQNVSIVVKGDKGSLNAVGTNEPIVFSKINGLLNDQIQGNWAGLFFINSPSSINLLDNVKIESAGARSTLYNFIYQPSALVVSSEDNPNDPGYLKIRNIQILDNQGNGIWQDSVVTLDREQGTNNIITWDQSQYQETCFCSKRP